MVPEPGGALLELYDSALPEVYGYLLARCRQPALAEDLTSETFLAAVDALGKSPPVELTTGWLIGVARHKLVDHWRRTERDERRLRLLAEAHTECTDPWEGELDALLAKQVLARLGAQHRAALTLRYLDGLGVAEVAEHLGRTLHATEALLVRARNAFRQSYADRNRPGTEGRAGR
ncbi:MAG TPA: sigma-70 family RNA polymerase sigma factor [Pseudonocardiaceae bacterium]|jgi:RNA polymerase sigma-70 factor (ECF subfamily)|nr:sigma-70 family RNA polymerase sigma factor [Pseudonocardiaceae bacterium]